MALKVIGAGLGRTGTMSLKLALEQLGYDKCYHMYELINDPSRLKYWKQLKNTNQTDYELLFKGYQSAVDYPACAFYQELLDQYPNAKVVLTVRDPEQWYESVKKTIYSASPKSAAEIIRIIFLSLTNRHVQSFGPVLQFGDSLVWKKHFNGKFKDKAYAIVRYLNHIEEVKKFVPADQLLIFNVQEGWAPLCNFLGKEIPALPFPKTNDTKAFEGKIKKLYKEGVVEV
jgi:hypothetical protein